ncbi:MAG: hypothetical protein ACOYO1_00705 [Bacteroidales bacterium]
MKFNTLNNSLGDIKAESIIAATIKDAVIEMHSLGSFYKNFSKDIIEIKMDSTNETVLFDISRDGIFHLLPETLFFFEKRLLIKKKTFNKKNEIAQEYAIKEEIKKQNADRKKLLTFFNYFDTKYFDLSLKLEKKIYEIVEIKVDLILSYFFRYELKDEKNLYIRKIAPLIIYSFQIRANLLLLQKILSVILNNYVEINKKYLRNDLLPEDIMVIEFIVNIERLSLSEYQNLNIEFKQFFNFISDWFLPYDIDYDFKIKDTSQRFILNKPLILDYNTQLL